MIVVPEHSQGPVLRGQPLQSVYKVSCVPFGVVRDKITGYRNQVRLLLVDELHNFRQVLCCYPGADVEITDLNQAVTLKNGM
jgi:hypothetical protein